MDAVDVRRGFRLLDAQHLSDALRRIDRVITYLKTHRGRLLVAFRQVNYQAAGPLSTSRAGIPNMARTCSKSSRSGRSCRIPGPTKCDRSAHPGPGLTDRSG